MKTYSSTYDFQVLLCLKRSQRREKRAALNFIKHQTECLNIDFTKVSSMFVCLKTGEYYSKN